MGWPRGIPFQATFNSLAANFDLTIAIPLATPRCDARPELEQAFESMCANLEHGCAHLLVFERTVRLAPGLATGPGLVFLRILPTHFHPEGKSAGVSSEVI